MKKIKQPFLPILEKFDEQRNNISRLWNVGQETAELLSFLVMLHNQRIILELGTSNGFSTFHLALPQTAKVISIDVEKARQDLARSNLQDFQHLELISDRIENYLPKIDYQIDLLFIDANKTNYLHYLLELEKHLAENALIIADNIDSHTGNIKKYQEYVTESDKYITIHLSIENGLLISRYQNKGNNMPREKITFQEKNGTKVCKLLNPLVPSNPLPQTEQTNKTEDKPAKLTTEIKPEQRG